MATSGVSTYAPEIAELLDDAWERCGIDPATVTQRHVKSARRSIELMFSEWASRGIHLWAVDQQTFTVADGDPSYDVTAGTIAVLEMVVTRDGIDTEVWPMARDEYLAIPDKAAEGLANRYYLDRVRLLPTITLWPVPDNATDVVKYYRMRRIYDGGAISNEPDVPYFWYEAFTAGLAAKLAEKYAPEREAGLVQKAGRAYDRADTEDRQRTPTVTAVRYGRR